MISDIRRERPDLAQSRVEREQRAFVDAWRISSRWCRRPCRKAPVRPHPCCRSREQQRGLWRFLAAELRDRPLHAGIEQLEVSAVN
jgi:hypothetical protein